jgi:PAS domain S-box-containing protein
MNIDGAVMRAALDRSPGAVIITDANGIIRWVNARFTAITGYTPAEALGQT